MSQPNNEIRKLEEFLKEIISRSIDSWEAGEGDISIEIRDDGGVKKAKIMGGLTTRIK